MTSEPAQPTTTPRDGQAVLTIIRQRRVGMLCYLQVQHSGPEPPRGTYRVELDIAPEGHVESVARVGGNFPTLDVMDRCVVDALSPLRFDPASERTTVRYGMSLGVR